jgi:hypothetical protein
MKSIFRIDDVSINTDEAKLQFFIELARNNGFGQVVLAVSPAVYDLNANDNPERVFPRIFNAESGHYSFLRPSKVGVPKLPVAKDVVLASHGLIHVDHRLLGRELQEFSILASCNLVDSAIFVPPFNKCNSDTIDICEEHDITLVMFEDGWKHVMYNPFSDSDGLYYVHTHDLGSGEMENWFRKKQ